jgi:hypothetical protein
LTSPLKDTKLAYVVINICTKTNYENDWTALALGHVHAALGPGVHSASNRNEYQKHKNNVSGEYSVANA